MLEAKTDRLADRQGSQVRIRIRGWRRGSTQNLDGREGCRVVHQRQIDQFLDCPAPKQGPDALVFASHLLLWRVEGPLDTDMSEVVETNSDRAAALIQGEADIDAQARDEGLFDRRRGAILTAPPIAPLRPITGRSKIRIRPGSAPAQRSTHAGAPSYPPPTASAPSIEIGERRGIRSRGLGSLARDQVEFGQLLPFVLREVISAAPRLS